MERHPRISHTAYKTDHRALALAVPCPRCGADVGERCYAPRVDHRPHLARQDRVVVALGGPFRASTAAALIADALTPTDAR